MNFEYGIIAQGCGNRDSCDGRISNIAQDRKRRASHAGFCGGTDHCFADACTGNGRAFRFSEKYFWLVSAIQICGFAILGVIVVVILRVFRPEYATVAGIVAGVILLGWTISSVSAVLDSVTALAENTGFSVYSSVILKSLGIGILAQTTADICRDSGVGAVGAKVEFAAKILILLMCVPILQTLMELIEGFLS